VGAYPISIPHRLGVWVTMLVLTTALPRADQWPLASVIDQPGQRTSR
jgi:hypothetical protein